MIAVGTAFHPEPRVPGQNATMRHVRRKHSGRSFAKEAQDDSASK